MILLDENQCRQLLLSELLNNTSIAKLFFEGEDKQPKLPHQALTQRLKAKQLTEETRRRLSAVVWNHFEMFAELYRHVHADDNSQFL
jgi:hypothetical protein